MRHLYMRLLTANQSPLRLASIEFRSSSDTSNDQHQHALRLYGVVTLHISLSYLLRCIHGQRQSIRRAFGGLNKTATLLCLCGCQELLNHFWCLQRSTYQCISVVATHAQTAQAAQSVPSNWRVALIMQFTASTRPGNE